MFELISWRVIASFKPALANGGRAGSHRGADFGGATELDTVGSARLPAASIGYGVLATTRALTRAVMS
jgi:hypothetical protein